MPARTYYSASATTRTTTTTTNYSAIKVTFAFTPAASKTYFILASASIDASGTGAAVGVRLQNTTGSVTYDEETRIISSTYVVPTWLTGIYVAPSSPSQQTVEIQFRGGSSTTMGIQHAHLSIVELGADDVYIESLTASSTSSTTYQTKATLSFTPPSAGDYAVIYDARIQGAAKARLLDGASVYGENLNVTNWTTADRTPVSTIKVKTGISAAQTFNLQYAANSGTVEIDYARVIAFRLNAFDDYVYGESRTTSSSSTTTYTDKVTLTDTPAAEDYLLLMCGIEGSSASTVHKADGQRGGVTIGVENTGWGSSSGRAHSWQLGLIQAQSAASTTWKTRWACFSGSGPIEWKESAILGIQLSGTAGAALTAAFLSSTSQFFTPTVTRGAVTVAPPALASAAVLRQPSVAPGSVTINPTAIVSSAVLHLPGLTVGAVGLAPPIIVNVAALHQASVAPGAVTLTPPAQTSTLALHQPTVTPPAQGISAAALAATLALHAPSVTTGAVTLSAAHLAATTALHAAALRLNLLAAALSSTAFLHSPDVAQGAVALHPPLIDSTETLTAPSITTGAVGLVAAAIASALALYTPSIGAGATDVELPAIASLTALHAPSLSLTLDLPALGATAATYAPSVAYGVSLPVVAATSALHQPSVAMGLASVFIGSEAGLHPPGLAPGSVLVALPVIESTETLYGASLTAHGALALAQIPSTAALYGPSLRLNLATAHRGSTEAFNSPSLALNLLASSLAPITALYGPSVANGAVALLASHMAATTALHAVTALRLNLLSAPMASTAALHQPAVTPPATGLAAASIAAALALYAPSAAPGAVALQPPHVDSTVALYAAVLDTGEVILAPPFIGSDAATFAPSLAMALAASHRASEETLHQPSLALNLLTDALASTAEIYAPLVPPPAGGLATAAIESAAALHEPLVTAVSALVAAYLDGTLATYAPSVARGPVTVFLPHIDTTVILRPGGVFLGASGITHRVSVTLAFGAKARAQLELAGRSTLQAPAIRRARVRVRWIQNDA